MTASEREEKQLRRQLVDAEEAYDVVKEAYADLEVENVRLREDHERFRDTLAVIASGHAADPTGYAQAALSATQRTGDG